ncbi:discoidin domain-containing protein [Pelosinus sp. IPA-1]|uniref:discoidin domain-containing protein n=1 Tax=Pelosinus sp. IPA-1 TaxID=3029569 RepID=UPI0025526803|nr:discoidin domain-containing protein [Pelosinus sp. IPA-1]
MNFNPFSEILVEDFLRQSGYIDKAINLLISDFLSQDVAVLGLDVTAQLTPDMSVYSKPGRIYQKGEQGEITVNSNPPLVITAAHPTYDRIDRICAQYQDIADMPETRNVMVDTVSRQVTQQSVMTRVSASINFMVVNGVAAPVPAAPTIPDGWVSLAQVKVRKNTTSILQTDILDERPTLKSLATHGHSGGIDGAKLSAGNIINSLISGLATTDVQSTLAAIYSEATKKGSNSARNSVITGPIDSNGNAAALYSDLTTSPIKIKAGTIINFANGFNGVNQNDIPYNVLADAPVTLAAADANTIPLQYTADLCNGGTAISGGDYASLPVGQAFDNNTATYWQGSQVTANQLGASYVGYNFGVAKAIRKIKTINSLNVANNIASVKVQYSSNGTNWNDACSQSLDTTIGASNYITVPPIGAYQYWRLLANSNLASGYGWAIYEIEMYEALQTYYIYATRAADGTVTYGATRQKPKTGKQYGSQITAGVLAVDDYAYSENRCVGGAFSASSVYGATSVQNAFDGNQSTYWESNNPGGSGDNIIYDFGVARHIRKMVIDHTMTDALHFMSSVKVQRSTDGTTWNDVYTATGLTSGVNTITLPSSTPSRYWRVLANAQTSGGPTYLWCITELTMHEICTDLTVYDPYQGVSRYFDGTNWTTVVRKFLGEAVVDSAGKIVSYITYDYNKTKLKALPAEDFDDVVTLGQLTASLQANGWAKIPVVANGVKVDLILQWLPVSVTVGAGVDSGPYSAALPIAFPSAALFCCGNVSTLPFLHVYSQRVSATKTAVTAACYSTVAQTVVFETLAIGI